MKPGQILSCYLVEDNVAVLGVNLVTHSLPGGPEPGDVGEVADVDGAVGAAQQPLPLHARHSLILHPQALEASVRVQLRRAKVQEVVVQVPTSPDLTPLTLETLMVTSNASMMMMRVDSSTRWQTIDYLHTPQHQHNLKIRSHSEIHF